MENIVYTNHIDVESFNRLRTAVGWSAVSPELAKKGLENTAFQVAATIDGKIIGMARVITDYGYTVLISDVAVLPEYQRMGIGKAMLEKVMAYIDESIAPGQTKFINLMAAKDKEGFYEKFGFERRPNDRHGCGMTQWIKK